MFMTNPQVPYSSILTCELMLGFGTAAPIKVQACPLQHQQKGLEIRLGRTAEFSKLIQTSHCKKRQHNTVQRVSGEDLLPFVFRHIDATPCDPPPPHDAARFICE